ncbi:MAG: hypothetical protein M1305_01275, partial [Candidatus Marsarchaeota archaeon]|nr:hypothetical protein [Candidatus Marsarchaeota archaeon]
LAGVMKYLERNWLVALHLPDVRWRVLDVFDAVTPSIASAHTEDEVRHWMERAGCAHIRTTGWCETSLAGVKGR